MPDGWRHRCRRACGSTVAGMRGEPSGGLSSAASVARWWSAVAAMTEMALVVHSTTEYVAVHGPVGGSHNQEQDDGGGVLLGWLVWLRTRHLRREFNQVTHGATPTQGRGGNEHIPPCSAPERHTLVQTDTRPLLSTDSVGLPHALRGTSWNQVGQWWQVCTRSRWFARLGEVRGTSAQLVEYYTGALQHAGVPPPLTPILIRLSRSCLFPCAVSCSRFATKLLRLYLLANAALPVVLRPAKSTPLPMCLIPSIVLCGWRMVRGCWTLATQATCKRYMAR